MTSPVLLWPFLLANISGVGYNSILSAPHSPETRIKLALRTDPEFRSTPTPERPWRGIWVGDYSVHGCEFLLINQPDVDEEGYKEPLVRLDSESDEEFEARFRTEKVYRGRLEAIKLTGDPNVPRGEYTFLAADLGVDGFVGIAQGPPFQGARVVKSQGHVAGVGFMGGEIIHSPHA